MKKNLIRVLAMIIFVVSLVLGVLNEWSPVINMNAEAIAWVCGVSFIVMAVDYTIAMWRKQGGNPLWQPGVAVIFALCIMMVQLLCNHLHILENFMNAEGLRWASYGLIALSVLAMGVIALVQVLIGCLKKNLEFYKGLTLFAGSLVLLLSSVLFADLVGLIKLRLLPQFLLICLEVSTIMTYVVIYVATNLVEMVVQKINKTA